MGTREDEPTTFARGEDAAILGAVLDTAVEGIVVIDAQGISS